MASSGELDMYMTLGNNLWATLLTFYWLIN